MTYRIEIWIDLFETKELKSINTMLKDCRADFSMVCDAPIRVYSFEATQILTQDEMTRVAELFKNNLSESLQQPVRIKIFPPSVEV